MGKHGNPGLTDGTKRALLLVAAVLVLGGAGGAYALNHRNSPSTPSAGASSTATSSTTSATDGNSPSATDSSTSPAVDALAAPLAACRAEVSAGNKLAAAAAASARDWGAHAGAEVQLDAGKITYAAAEKIWAASKAPGAADLAAFAAAEPVYKKAAGGCASLVTAAAAAGASAPAEAAACVARSKALASVATTGAKVNAQWAAHQAQMKTKATAAGPAYHEKWMNFVADSKPVLAAYGRDAATLAKAPACS